MNQIRETHALTNGTHIPRLGYGTWQLDNSERSADLVALAIASGYAHIDTAQGYRNEEAVGSGILKSQVKREDIYITSKLVNSIRGYAETKAAIQDSLNRLQTDYMDLFLLHWPNPIGVRENWAEMNLESWRAMEEAVEAGYIKSLGVSNFLIRHLEPLLSAVKIKPVVNQIKLHPGVIDQETIDYSKQNGLAIEAYSPLGHGEIFEVEVLLELAKKYNKSVQQVILRWHWQDTERIIIPKSSTPEHIVSNTKIFDFQLEPAEVERINALDFPEFYVGNPDEKSF